MKKQPLFIQLTITMIVVVVIIVAGSWVLNQTQLEEYYVKEKLEDLIEAYGTIDIAETEGVLSSSDFDVTFEKLCAAGNFNILVLQEGSGIIRSNSSSDFAAMQMNELYYGTGKGDEQILYETSLYKIERRNDKRMQTEYLMLWGYLSDESLILIRTPLESIKESANISLRFFSVVAVGALLISIVMILLLSRQISKPIRNLTEIAYRMSRLDFDAQYLTSPFVSKEIETLGYSMNEMSENLEHAIADLKIANNELQRDIQRKEEIDSMRKEFLSNVSHELKTPLALISGYAEGLKDNINEDQESRDFYCEVIIDEAEKMNQMVKQLLSLNQLEFGNNQLEIDRFDMTELVKGVVSANSLLAEQSGANIVFEETKPKYIWADEFKVEQVMTNFMTNAIHHCEGEKRIIVKYQEHDGLLRVCVFNTGKPIPEEAIDRLWEKFYKVDKARTREYGGSGIGLSIVKAIMDSHNKACGVNNYSDGVEFWAEFDCNLDK